MFLWVSRVVLCRPVVSALLSVCCMMRYDFQFLCIQAASTKVLHGSSICSAQVFYRVLGIEMLGHDDFNDCPADSHQKGMGKAAKRQKQDSGQPRFWLRVYETLPAQMLNAYGVAQYTKMGLKQVWSNLVKPLKTGAMFMTEYASEEDERRGIAANRWLLSLLTYCQYQKRVDIKKQNQYLLQDNQCTELYAEIDLVYPSLEFCLAPKKVFARAGSSALRSGATASEVVVDGMVKTTEELDRHAKKLYEWVNQPKSAIRRIMVWQAAGALPYVASVHHLATQCFLTNGNEYHEGSGEAVSLNDFQKAIQARHRIGSAGVSETGDGLVNDFA